MPIRPEYFVNLKGKQYPVYAGVLIAALESGLRFLTVEHIQLPTEANGWTAVMKAKAEFEDGRIFEDYGDCSPKNTSPQIAVAAIRMASTRAKGRVLRDAIGCGETLREELPDAEDAPGNGHHAAPPSEPIKRAPVPASTGTVTCEHQGCNEVLNKNMITRSQHHVRRNLCPEHCNAAIAEMAQK